MQAIYVISHIINSISLYIKASPTNSLLVQAIRVIYPRTKDHHIIF
jgi:hypothetical protein